MAIKWSSIGSVVEKLAPTLASAIGGPFAGAAVGNFEASLGINKPAADIGSRKDDIAAALGTATQAQLLAVKAADDNFKESMAKLGFDNEKDLATLGDSDRDSARKREISVKDWTPKALTIVIFVSFLGVLIYSRYVTDAHLDIVKDALETLRDAIIMVVSYYFGSSSESSKKTDILAAGK
jgi:hypothetical protein